MLRHRAPFHPTTGPVGFRLRHLWRARAGSDRFALHARRQHRAGGRGRHCLCGGAVSVRSHLDHRHLAQTVRAGRPADATRRRRAGPARCAEPARSEQRRAVLRHPGRCQHRRRRAARAGAWCAQRPPGRAVADGAQPAGWTDQRRITRAGTGRPGASSIPLSRRRQTRQHASPASWACKSMLRGAPLKRPPDPARTRNRVRAAAPR